ncbi:putative defense protein isoform X2 [Bacillus rossius redtenbacheri]|uniref:putative defense protein isoform X2 n=1 Tax=Bacillus rossius redtenbacheri TaxID=93214 RepID=UPI002FDDAA76
MKYYIVASVLLAALCAGMPADPEPDFWFSTSVHPSGPPALRLRRASGGQAPVDPDHVPSSVCRNMTPSHGGSEPQAEPWPYTVSVDKRRVAPGDIVTVTVSGTDSFKGIYIQGRIGDTPVGTFQPHENEAVVISDCDPGTDNALSYVSRTALDNIELKWKAPNTPGNVIFRCTVVKSFREFWVGIKSPEIQIVRN